MKNKLFTLLALPMIMVMSACNNTNNSTSASNSTVNSVTTLEPSKPNSITDSGLTESVPTLSETESLPESLPVEEPSLPSVEEQSLSTTEVPSLPSIEVPSTPSETESLPSQSVSQPSIPNNYGGHFELESKTGDEKIHINGAGVWIWVSSNSIGYLEGTNTIEDFSLEVILTAEKDFQIIEQQITLYGEIRDRVRVYLALNIAPNIKDELSFYVKITSPNGKYYDNTINFIGSRWSEEEVGEKADGGEFELFTTGEGNRTNHIEGAGVWIWIKADSIGYNGNNAYELIPSDVQILNNQFIINDYFFSDFSTEAIRLYIILDKAPGSEDTLTFRIKIENDAYYYSKDVTFVGGVLA